MPSALLTFIKFLSRPLFDIGGNSISVITIFVAVLLFWSSTFLSNLSVKLTYRILNKADLERGVRESFAKVSKYLTLFLGIMISLSALGFNLNSIAAISAVLGVGIGFGLQNITQNFMSGLIILFERPIKVGDLVEVNGVSGRVVEINFRSTLIHTRDDVAIIVPNSKFIAEQVVNESFSGEKIRLHLRVGVAYGTDVQKVKEILLKIAQENEGVLMTPPPSVIFEDFADSSLNFKLRVWVKELWTTEDILSELRFQVDKAFKENNISIPFPQRDVWIKEQKN
ncbi:MAG: mechanosensitive ion channel [Halobacteriovoraceae bacterium]|nr:mechanosensitive ion channel [Halobacteriovoraceae bacterium]